MTYWPKDLGWAASEIEKHRQQIERDYNESLAEIEAIYEKKVANHKAAYDASIEELKGDFKANAVKFMTLAWLCGAVMAAIFLSLIG